MKPAQRFEDMPPYTPIEPFEVLSARLGIPVEQIVKLDANENPYGPSPLASKALAELQFAHIYPDPESRELREALSVFCGTPPEHLLAGAGADELIDLLLRVMLEPGDVVLNCPPTFGMYAFDAHINAARVVEVPRNTDFSLNLAALQEAVARYHPRVIFVTSPNNPDGRLMSDQEYDALIAMPALVVLDEAYIEFSADDLGIQNSRIAQVPLRENLVVLRTFSKWAGLAGLRVGYGAFPKWLLPVLWKVKQPYNVNVAAAKAAVASLADRVTLVARVDDLRAERQRLFSLLSEIGYLQAYPSAANFILCKVLDRPARELKHALMQAGILVRYYETALLQDFIRISVGRQQDTQRIIAALQELTGTRNNT